MMRKVVEWEIVYLPTGRVVKCVEAVSELAAKRKAGYHNWTLHVVWRAEA